MQTIVNAAPGIVNYGVDDQSGRPYTRAPEELPQHLPKFLIYAQTGPTDEQLLGGADRGNGAAGLAAKRAAVAKGPER